MSQQGTIVAQKQRFLLSRKQYLSRGIAPSEKLKQIAHEGGIDLGMLKGVVDKTNRELKQHSRRVYSRQMSDHVVEQIDLHYWDAGAQDVDEDGLENTLEDAEDAHAVFQNDDLTQDANIEKLPLRWDTSSDVPDDNADDNELVDQDAYLSALTRLQDLSAHRLTLQQKANTYRTLLALLEPYRKPKQSVQKNLVWKDGPLGTELGRTRTLAIRVAGRVGERFADSGEGARGDADEMEVEMDGKEKVGKVLESW